ncbi:hypothetical protein COLO4_21182 [Corchorus olitorius]|uniref:Uncharacterized protein n=1 Tax=Corchorus olitorius TaxID=93759 RepID=A0A1R3IV01_9ROSI|nr:hypothetical protein COLO4_21182 [Corchorus olitorius]
MAFLARNDPFLKQFHTLPNDHRRCHPFLGKLDFLENHNVGAGFKFQKPASGLNLTLKSCFEDSLKTWDHKARAFAPQLARDLEIISHKEPQKLAKPATDTRGACQRGNPLDFSDNPLPEKISVAVDVDEVSEYHVYEFFKIWNCSRDEADIRVHEFFKTPYFKKGF